MSELLFLPVLPLHETHRNKNRPPRRRQKKYTHTKITSTATRRHTKCKVYSGVSTAVVQNTSAGGRGTRGLKYQNEKQPCSRLPSRKSKISPFQITQSAKTTKMHALHYNRPRQKVYEVLSSCGGSSRLQVGHSILMSIHRVRHP